MFILFLLIFKAWILNTEYLIQIRIKSSRYYITKAASETLAFVFALVNIKVSVCKHTALLPIYNFKKVTIAPVLLYVTLCLSYAFQSFVALCCEERHGKEINFSTVIVA